jgi:plastocyanin
MRQLRVPHRSVALLLIALVGVGCSDEKPKGASVTSDQTPAAPKARSGRIRGVVRFVGKLPDPVADAITQDQSTCGKSVSLQRLVLGKNNGVQYAFVYLDGIQGAGELKSPVPVLVDQKNCQYAPHAVIVPMGAPLEFTNSDPILHNVHGRQRGDDGLQTIFNIAQPIRGQRTATPALTKPGIVSLSCEAGHPWMSAYVFVANHPFVAVTGDEGQFTIPDVPAGKYRIKMWHAGVRPKQIVRAMQSYEYEEPYEVTQDVVVRESEETKVDFDLTLRPAV